MNTTNTLMERVLDQHAKAPSTVERQLFLLQATVESLQMAGWTVLRASALASFAKPNVMVAYDEAKLKDACAAKLATALDWLPGVEAELHHNDFVTVWVNQRSEDRAA